MKIWKMEKRALLDWLNLQDENKLSTLTPQTLYKIAVRLGCKKLTRDVSDFLYLSISTVEKNIKGSRFNVIVLETLKDFSIKYLIDLKSKKI